MEPSLKRTLDDLYDQEDSHSPIPQKKARILIDLTGSPSTAVATGNSSHVSSSWSVDKSSSSIQLSVMDSSDEGSSSSFSSSSSSMVVKKKKITASIPKQVTFKLYWAQSESMDDFLTNTLPVRHMPKFALHRHQEIIMKYAIGRMAQVKYEETPTKKYSLVSAPNSNIRGGAIIAQKGMGKSRMMLELAFRHKRITGPWLLFEMFTLFKEIRDCLYTHYPPEYHQRILFYHPEYIGVDTYKKMTTDDFKHYTIIVMTIESYVSMVFDFGFHEESGIYGSMDNGQRRLLGYGECTYEQTQERLRYGYVGPAALTTIHFDGIMVDESQSLRNMNTKRTVALTTVARFFNFIFSGDPLVNSANDFFGQLKLLGYAGASSVKDWEEHMNYYIARDKMMETFNPDEAAIQDRSNAVSPIKIMSIKRDSPELQPPPLHLENIHLDFRHPLEIEVNAIMAKIMQSLLTAASNSKLSKNYIIAFFSVQNMAKIAPYLLCVKSRRNNYKSKTENMEDKTVIGDDAFNSYSDPDNLCKLIDGMGINPTSLNLVSAPVENSSTDPANSFTKAEEDNVLEFGSNLLQSVAPNLMTDLIADINGPAGIKSTSMQWIAERIRDIFQCNYPAECKIIIGTNYNSSLDLIVATIAAEFPNEPLISIDGSIKGRKREGLLEKFQKSTRNRLLVINSKIGSYGLNLTEANYIIDVDGWYNNVASDQFTARCWRPGQKFEVYSYRLFRNNTIDEHILKLRAAKQSNIDDFWARLETMSDAEAQKLDFLNQDKKKTTTGGSSLNFNMIKQINNYNKPKAKKKEPIGWPPVEGSMSTTTPIMTTPPASILVQQSKRMDPRTFGSGQLKMTQYYPNAPPAVPEMKQISSIYSETQHELPKEYSYMESWSKLFT